MARCRLQNHGTAATVVRRFGFCKDYVMQREPGNRVILLDN
jgi:hypothetical protein